MVLRAKKRDAFTLLEVMIAIVIIGILATLVVPNVMKRWKNVRVNQTQATMAALKSALLDYKNDMGQFPTRREGGLQVLVEKPNIKGAENWDGPYLEGKKIPVDAWGQEFEYNRPPERYKGEGYKYFEIISPGPDPEAGEPEIHMGA